MKQEIEHLGFKAQYSNIHAREIRITPSGRVSGSFLTTLCCDFEFGHMKKWLMFIWTCNERFVSGQNFEMKYTTCLFIKAHSIWRLYFEQVSFFLDFCFVFWMQLGLHNDRMTVETKNYNVETKNKYLYSYLHRVWHFQTHMPSVLYLKKLISKIKNISTYQLCKTKRL